ncbi:MAG: iron-containing alcohol dehydrogenase [Clostridia bacterium]|nr:iron-containing alcohol dehydrogenase [Clostridia bacterium]
MNILKKIYCRVFQTVFRIALPLLPYRDPVQLEKISDIVKIAGEKNLSCPLIVTDRSIRQLGLIKPLEEELAKNNYKYAVYDKTEQNPTTHMVMEALSHYKSHNCDFLIAFGGGSPMDCAKAVGACVARPKTDLKKMAGILKVIRRTPTIVAVPTTAGTGSETTLASVIVDSKTRLKYVINDFPLIPSYAVLDSSVVHTLPQNIAAATGMDALTHAIEAYIGRSTTKGTRADAEKSVKLIFENIEKSSSHESANAEKAMLLASHLAGRAFTRSYVGYIHAVSHSLSGKYNMPHGLTNAILLPIVLEMYGSSVYKKLAKLARISNIGKPDADDSELAKDFIKEIYALNRRLGIPDYIDGIKKEDIETLSNHADKEANPLYPVPILWDKDELKRIYRRAGKIQ